MSAPTPTKLKWVCQLLRRYLRTYKGLTSALPISGTPEGSFRAFDGTEAIQRPESAVLATAGSRRSGCCSERLPSRSLPHPHVVVSSASVSLKDVYGLAGCQTLTAQQGNMYERLSVQQTGRPHDATRELNVASAFMCQKLARHPCARTARVTRWGRRAWAGN